MFSCQLSHKESHRIDGAGVTLSHSAADKADLAVNTLAYTAQLLFIIGGDDVR